MSFFDLFRSKESVIESRFEEAIEEAKNNAENEEQFKELAELNLSVCKSYLESTASDLPLEKREEFDMLIEEKYNEALNSI